jgi:hypothetical protein
VIRKKWFHRDRLEANPGSVPIKVEDVSGSTRPGIARVDFTVDRFFKMTLFERLLEGDAVNPDEDTVMRRGTIGAGRDLLRGLGAAPAF